MMFIWTIGDVIALGLIAFGIVGYVVLWLLHTAATWERRRRKRKDSGDA